MRSMGRTICRRTFRAALTQVQLSIPVIDGALALGSGQGVYLFEHRAAPQRRHVLLQLIW